MNEVAKIDFNAELTSRITDYDILLPQDIDVNRFISFAYTSIHSSQKVKECNPASIFKAVREAAQANLFLDGRQAALVPYKGECQCMVMYNGLITLMQRNSELLSISADAVYKNDGLIYRKGSDEVLIHEPNIFGDRGDFIGTYAVAKFKNGALYTAFSTAEEIERVKGSSKTLTKKDYQTGAIVKNEDSPWNAWFEAMAIKTAIRKLAKIVPLEDRAREAMNFIEHQERPKDIEEQPAALAPPSLKDMRAQAEEEQEEVLALTPDQIESEKDAYLTQMDEANNIHELQCAWDEIRLYMFNEAQQEQLSDRYDSAMRSMEAA